jgi:hypothetical protein
MKVVPREKNGHPLPPSVPSEQISLLGPREWERWWLETKIQEPCCVCGIWGSQFMRSNMKFIHAEVQRTRLNTRLNELFLCKSCKELCKQCRIIIPRPQHEQRSGLCETCQKKK